MISLKSNSADSMPMTGFKKAIWILVTHLWQTQISFRLEYQTQIREKAREREREREREKIDVYRSDEINER